MVTRKESAITDVPQHTLSYPWWVVDPGGWEATVGTLHVVVGMRDFSSSLGMGVRTAGCCVLCILNIVVRHCDAVPCVYSLFFPRHFISCGCRDTLAGDYGSASILVIAAVKRLVIQSY